ncbi:hypothetical protein GR7B_00236 [Vibrio phage vB_VcorM_GR7B]|nr:hypothetical protein GR7B_00236 [Vibrio phage vB_VcorM_GR7B]
MKTMKTFSTALTSLATAIVAQTNEEGKFAFEGASVSLTMQKALIDEAAEQIKEPTLITRVGGKSPYWMLSLASAIAAKQAAAEEEESEEGEEESLEDTIAELEDDAVKALADALEIDYGRKGRKAIVKLILEEGEDSVWEALNAQEEGEEEADDAEAEQEELTEDEKRERAIELGLKKKKAKKMDEEELDAWLAENDDEAEAEAEQEEDGGFVYVVFEDEDDAEEAVKALSKVLDKNGFAEADIPNVVGHNGADDEETYSHVYIDAEEYENSLKAALKKFAKKADLEVGDDGDYEVYEEDEYLAEFSDAEAEEESEDGDEAEEEESEAPLEDLYTEIVELAPIKGKKGAKTKLEKELSEIDLTSPRVKDLTMMAELCSYCDEDEVTELVEKAVNAIEDEAINKRATKAFKAFL